MRRLSFLVLTDINVSNIHLMIAEVLKEISSFEVKFLNTRSPQLIYNDSEWYGLKSFTDQSKELIGKNLFKKIFTIFKIILQSDVIFGSGEVMNLVRLSGKPYIYWCTGSDLDQYSKTGCTIYEYLDGKSNLKRRIIRRLKKFLYRYAIRGAKIAIVAPYQFADIVSLGFRELGFFPHILEIEYLNQRMSDRKEAMKKLKKEYECDWIFFSSTRHEWREELIDENDHKGNDMVIKSFYYFKQSVKNSISKLFLVEKGYDVERSKALIADLGIQDSVVWLAPMNRKRLIEFYSGAHACFDQFSKGCLALCAIEAMACGAPTVSFIGNNKSQVPFYPEAPPLFNSKDPVEIAEFLVTNIIDDNKRNSLEKKSFQWVRRHCTYDEIRRHFKDMTEGICDIK